MLRLCSPDRNRERQLSAPVAQWSTVLFGEPKSSGLSSRRPRVRFPPGALRKRGGFPPSRRQCRGEGVVLISARGRSRPLGPSLAGGCLRLAFQPPWLGPPRREANQVVLAQQTVDADLMSHQAGAEFTVGGIDIGRAPRRGETAISAGATSSCTTRPVASPRPCWKISLTYVPPVGPLGWRPWERTMAWTP